MFTDIHIINKDTCPGASLNLAVFEKDTLRTIKNVENCPVGWSSVIRIPWALSFCFIKSSENISENYPLKKVYKEEGKKYLLFKNGSISIQQSFLNGKQVIDFHQIRGSQFSGVQIYRGEFLIDELHFTGSQLQFRIDSIIGISLISSKQEIKNSLISSESIEINIVGKKTVNLSGNQNSRTKFKLNDVENW